MRRRLCFIVCLALWAFPGLASAREADGIAQGATTPLSFSFDYSNFGSIIAGVAGDADVAFVGEPLSGAVAVLSRITGRQIAELPPPPGNGFVLPFIMHTVGKGRLAVLDAGGLPQPKPFVPAHPVIYQYNYGYTRGSFEARLERTVSFDSVTIGFPEDFVHLGDARYLLSDAVLGSIWVAQPDGTITPGIVPKTFDPQDLIPTLAFCPTMPEISVNGYPFLFSGSTIPGISPLAVRDGTVYFYSPCARGLYAFPVSVLSDGRQPYQRADSIRLVAPTPGDVPVEELLDFTFDPFNPADPYLYAADPLQMKVIRIDPASGRRQVLAENPALFDFPSSLAFLPTGTPLSELLVASNQQERTPLTNDAVTDTTFNLPFKVGAIAFER